MKATITNLRKMNQYLYSFGVEIILIELARKNGKAYTHNTPYRSWGKTIGTSRDIMNAMIDTCNILQLPIPNY